MLKNFYKIFYKNFLNLILAGWRGFVLFLLFPCLPHSIPSSNAFASTGFLIQMILFSAHSEYFFSSDLLLGMSFLGWLLFLWLRPKKA